MHIPNQSLVQLIHFRDQKWLSQTSNYSFVCTFHNEVDASKYQMFQNIQKECSCRYTNCPIRQICKHQICERRTPEGTPYRGNRSITALQILPYKSKSQTAAIHITLEYTALHYYASASYRKSRCSSKRFCATVGSLVMCVMPVSGNTVCSLPAASNACERRSV